MSYLSLGVVDETNPEKPRTKPAQDNPASTQASSPPAAEPVASTASAEPASTAEIVKLRSKWITQTEAKQTPLPVYTLNHELMDLGVVDAHALATDKVIKVSPAREAPSKAAGKDVYRDEEWTYAEAMAQYTDPLNRPILIDMESYGIASVAVPIGEDLGIIVLRVATDALNDKRNQGKPDQQRLLTEPLPALAQIIARIAEPGSPPV